MLWDSLESIVWANTALCCQHLIVSLSNIISCTGEQLPYGHSNTNSLALKACRLFKVACIHLWHRPHKDINFLSGENYVMFWTITSQLSNFKRKELCLSESSWLKPETDNVFLQIQPNFQLQSTVCFWLWNYKKSVTTSWFTGTELRVRHQPNVFLVL